MKISRPVVILWVATLLVWLLRDRYEIVTTDQPVVAYRLDKLTGKVWRLGLRPDAPTWLLPEG